MMKKWIQKSLMAAVAVVTLGAISPSHDFWQQFDSDKSTYSTLEELKASIPKTPSIDDFQDIQFDVVLDEPKAPSIDDLKLAAKEQAYIKFGSRIAPKIGDEFDERIYPKMLEAIDMTVARLDDDMLQQLAITETPSGHYKERIFHIKDSVTQGDIIRFHVRTENRVDEGYYYNFHYHTFDDQFATHYDLGEIFWSKNTPPKWLS